MVKFMKSNTHREQQRFSMKMQLIWTMELLIIQVGWQGQNISTILCAQEEFLEKRSRTKWTNTQH